MNYILMFFPLLFLALLIYIACAIIDGVTSFKRCRNEENQETLRNKNTNPDAEKVFIPYLPGREIADFHLETPLEKFLRQFGKQIGSHFAEKTSFEIPLAICKDCQDELVEWLQRKDVVAVASVDNGKISVVIK